MRLIRDVDAALVCFHWLGCFIAASVPHATRTAIKTDSRQNYTCRVDVGYSTMPCTSRSGHQGAQSTFYRLTGSWVLRKRCYIWFCHVWVGRTPSRDRRDRAVLVLQPIRRVRRIFQSTLRYITIFTRPISNLAGVPLGRI